jgi:CRISPR/Cas system-associated endonuclease Cas1
MNTLFDETEADAEVCRNIIKHKEKNIMRLFKGDNNQIFKVVESEEVSREQLEEKLSKAERRVVKYRQALADFDALNPQPQEQPQPEPEQTPVPQAPIEAPEQPTDPIAPIQ